MQAKLADRAGKAHLTQMQTINSDVTPSAQLGATGVFRTNGRESIDAKAATLDAKSRMPGRFTTVTDSYFRTNSKVAPTVDFE